MRIMQRSIATAALLALGALPAMAARNTLPNCGDARAIARDRQQTP